MYQPPTKWQLVRPKDAICHLPVDGQILSVALAIGEAVLSSTKYFLSEARIVQALDLSDPHCHPHGLRKWYCDTVVL